MATELETRGDSHQQCLERGTRLLRALQRAARAARLEAQVAELQSALDEARAGHGRRLQCWLEAFEHGSDYPEQAATDNSLVQAVPDDRAHDVGVKGWAALLPHAQRRLSERAAPSILTTGGAAAGDQPSLFVKSDEDAAALETEDAPSGDSSESLHVEWLGTVKPATDAERDPTINRPMMNGMSLSLVAHVVLLFALFMITYRLPRESASLGTEVVSVTAVTENVETSQPVDLPQPVEIDLPELNLPASDQVPPTALSELSPPEIDSTVPTLASRQPAGGPVFAAAASTGSSSNGGSAGARGGSGGGPPSKTGGKFFGVGAGGNFFCYVVDSSGSMRGTAWQSAKDELLRSLTTLSQRQRFLIVFFSKEFAAIPEPGERTAALHGLLATPDNVDHARRWIETIQLDRGGPPNDALAWAIDREPDAIYLLTDGVTKTDVCGFLREKNRINDFLSGPRVRVPIHAIAYHSLDGQQLLRQIAEENEGQFHYVPAGKR